MTQPQIKIPAMYMRGGTSKGVFFRLQDLPKAAQVPGAARDALLMRVIDGFRGLEVIYVMTFGGPGQATELFSLHIYKAAFISQKLGYSAALSLLLLALVATLSLAVLLIANPLKTSSRR